jgi:hypothetical protein
MAKAEITRVSKLLWWGDVKLQIANATGEESAYFGRLCRGEDFPQRGLAQGEQRRPATVFIDRDKPLPRCPRDMLEKSLEPPPHGSSLRRARAIRGRPPRAKHAMQQDQGRQPRQRLTPRACPEKVVRLFRSGHAPTL